MTRLWLASLSQHEVCMAAFRDTTTQVLHEYYNVHFTFSALTSVQIFMFDIVLNFKLFHCVLFIVYSFF